MKKELIKRLVTSVILIILLFFMLKFTIVLLSSLLIVFVFSWLEFNSLLEKIFTKKLIFLKYISKLFIFFYLLFFLNIIVQEFILSQPNVSKNILFVIFICILSDVGGYVFGKTFKGKKLTKISPNKTYSGMIGSFVFSTIFAILYSYFIDFQNLDIFLQVAVTTSLVCQIGDLFVSYLKRRSKVKDTGNILPGHGGVLDRIDGILFALPFGITLTNYLY